MAKTCGNCFLSTTGVDYIPVERFERGECWCNKFKIWRDCDGGACGHWKGDIKLPEKE